jgi:hypothetical protein
MPCRKTSTSRRPANRRNHRENQKRHAAPPVLLERSAFDVVFIFLAALSGVTAFFNRKYPAKRGENPSSVRCPAFRLFPPLDFPKMRE